MPLALDHPSPSGVLTHWTPQPVAIVLVVVLGLAYAYGVRGLGRPWPRGRSVTFAVGLALLLWGSCGFPQVYADSVFWVWTSQTLGLWLLVPIVVLSGHPVQLARLRVGRDSRLERALRSRPVRVVSNPLVGPALVPLLSFAFFFGPVPGWAIASAPVGWVFQLLLLAIGAAMVLPLVGLDDDVSSLAVGLSLVVGSFELVIDALPGIVLRLSTHVSTSWFDHATVHPWTKPHLADQQLAGGILWCIAELIDLPFLYLVFRRWLRADARDAARVDAVLEAERISRGPAPVAEGDVAPVVERDAPWWLSDPQMQRRLNRRD
ncbi:cytochrome c oxidase assembly protein [Jatrophihabitans endophyticus]|uniref:cytochrome c oxidase assembly protein n=1 Tax=Jatrophihabitans endophyticus TaxID=1206085 RepID=UPI001A0E16B5|nr:cytochrome c oxidase assembly protein [Jatrophihabitans endophyticus]MBE7187283.1 cytochrome c oxidase assembly protein [Jatrophihabitans endophyticus]